jgi:uncharacterized protein (TIGR03000 family)
MYSIVLATVLATGNAAPAADIYTDIRDLKRAVEELRQEQTDTRVEELKLIIAGLRQRITDEKLDEIRRDVRLLQEEEVVPAAVPLPMPAARTAPAVTRATITVQVPSGARFVVDNKEIPIPPVDPTFVTPPLEPGKDYFYDCKVTVVQDGKTVIKVKRVKVHAGELVRLDYDGMEAQ